MNAKRIHVTQSGVALFIVLIVLVAMSIGGVALVRSIETSSLVSGNLAFKMSALHATDVAVENAITDFPSILSASADANYPANCASASASPNGCRYYATMQAVDTKGVPTAINWNFVQSTEPLSGYKVQYVIDRLCNGPAPVTDLNGKCLSDAPLGGGSQKAGAPKFTGVTTVFYRVTVRVEGPRSTESFAQVIISK